MKLKNFLSTLLLTMCSTILIAQDTNYLTVGQAMQVYYSLELGSGAKSTEIYTVRGYVTQWNSGYPQYQNADFWIDDTPDGSTSRLKAFRVTAQNSADQHKLEVGDYVEVVSQFMCYGTIAELAYGTFSVISSASAAEYKGETTIADFIAQKDLKNIYQLKGAVSIENEAQGNLYLTDATGSIYVYGVLDKNGESGNFSGLGVDNGDTLTIRGVYYEYKTQYTTTVEIRNAQYISHKKPSIVTGKCGDNITYTIDAYTSTMTMEGFGDMWDRDKWEQPISGTMSVYEVTNVVIPEGVTSIGMGAFANCHFKSLTIPTSVTKIGVSAFQSSHIETIIIPKNVKEMAFPTFDNCYQLRNIIVDENNPSYSSQDGVLFNKKKSDLIMCPMMKGGSYAVPNSVEKIFPSAFEGCSNLTSISMGDNVKYIYEHAFYECAKLTNLKLSNDLHYVSYGIIDKTPIAAKSWNVGLYFNNCLLSVLEFDNDNPLIVEEEYSVVEGTKVIAEMVFAVDYDITKITIPSSIEHIGIDGLINPVELVWNATNCADFIMTDYKGETHTYNPTIYDWYESDNPIPPTPPSASSIRQIHQEDNDEYSRVKNITFGSNVKHIPAGLCSGMRFLENIYCNINDPISISDDMFEQVNKQTCILYVPKGSKSKYQTANVWREFTIILEIGETALENISGTSNQKPIKLVENNNMIIYMPDGTKYTILGNQIK